MTRNWQALAREGGLAAEHLGIGVTALSKANYAHNAHYAQAFFALSIGMERASKLALLVDHAIVNNGVFPTNSELRSYGHDLKTLLYSVDALPERRGWDGEVRRLPRSEIHDAIIEVLTGFATNVTRYFNLDFVTNAPNVSQRTDPVADWYGRVILRAFDQCVSAKQRAKIQQNARIIDAMMGPISMVSFYSENGEHLDNVFDASAQTGLLKASEPYVRLHVLQIIRFLADIFSELSHRSMQARLEDIPYFSDFFAIYNNDDAMLKSRKSWSIYKP